MFTKTTSAQSNSYYARLFQSRDRARTINTLPFMCEDPGSLLSIIPMPPNHLKHKKNVKQFTKEAGQYSLGAHLIHG